jgi:ribonuclease R
VYRIHDRPDPEKLQGFANFIRQFGYSIKTASHKAIAESMNLLINQVNGKNEQYVIESLAIRTMAKAKYSTNNIGHYGLSFDFYTQFYLAHSSVSRLDGAPPAGSVSGG